jgi:hypothetical protein
MGCRMNRRSSSIEIERPGICFIKTNNRQWARRSGFQRNTHEEEQYTLTRRTQAKFKPANLGTDCIEQAG